ncbi:MAG: alpha-amylase family glycosyl hydrolase [Vicinamibacterales bacterium]
MSDGRETTQQQAEPGNPADWSRIPYMDDPDYSKPLLEIPADSRERMLGRLRFLYGEEKAGQAMPELERILRVHHAHKPDDLIEAEHGIDPAERFTERDLVLITYGDMVEGPKDATPMATLHRFVSAMNRGAINTIHIPPFFPYSSDRGFSVVDFTRVDPKLGTWEDVRRMGLDYALMFDGVLNHCSSKSRMFSHFLNGNPYYQDYFISYDHPDELTAEQRRKIFRPRTSDILTRFDTYNGPKYVWTTFSADQIDLNFRSPAVLLRIVDGLLLYARNGADIIRLDAVTYVWADPGTECVHLPETHEIVKLLRDVMNVAAPGVALLTETNVPHEANISYFGNGHDEAHMVYNFALPPLVLHALYREDATALARWAQQIRNPSDTATFFNVLDTHDGIGLMAVKALLPGQEIDFVIQRAAEHGALVSYKLTESGTEEPYELNTTWWSAVNGDGRGEDLDLQIRRYLASRSIALVLQGVPGIYAHGAVGSSSDHALARMTNHKRDVNRATIDVGRVAEEVKSPGSRAALLASRWPALSLTRTRERAFHPHGGQRVVMTAPQVFTVLRTSPEGDRHVLAMTNLSKSPCSVTVPLSDLGIAETRWRDAIGGRRVLAEGGALRVALQPYDVVWLQPGSQIPAGVVDR